VSKKSAADYSQDGAVIPHVTNDQEFVKRGAGFAAAAVDWPSSKSRQVGDIDLALSRSARQMSLRMGPTRPSCTDLVPWIAAARAETKRRSNVKVREIGIQPMRAVPRRRAYRPKSATDFALPTCRRGDLDVDVDTIYVHHAARAGWRPDLRQLASQPAGH